MSDWAKQLDDLLREAGLVAQFGLVNQGHMPRVVEMLAAGEGWSDIGRAIGWNGKAAAENFEMEFGVILERLKAAEARATAAEQERDELARLAPETRLPRWLLNKLAAAERREAELRTALDAAKHAMADVRSWLDLPDKSEAWHRLNREIVAAESALASPSTPIPAPSAEGEPKS